MSTASWAYQAPVLSRHYRLLLYDCRGMWQSEHPPGPYSMELHADDLAALLDAPGHRAGPHRRHLLRGGGEHGLCPQVPGRTQTPAGHGGGEPPRPAAAAAFADLWIAAARAGTPTCSLGRWYPLTFSEAWIAANPAALALARQRYEALDMDAFLELLLCFRGWT
jgi:3-oxoadipate enol-lactonase